MRRRAPAAAAAIVAALALGGAGCGGDDTVPAPEGAAGDDVEQIEAVTASFARAVEQKDARAFCDLLAPNDVEKLGRGKTDGKKECLVVWGPKRNPLFAAESPDLRVAAVVEIDSGSATAKLATGGELAYLREGGGWYVHLAPAPASAKDPTKD